MAKALAMQPVGLLLTLLCALAGAGLACADTPRIGAEDDWYPYTAWRDEQIVGMSADIVRAAFASSETPIAATTRRAGPVAMPGIRRRHSSSVATIEVSPTAAE